MVRIIVNVAFKRGEILGFPLSAGFAVVVVVVDVVLLVVRCCGHTLSQSSLLSIVALRWRRWLRRWWNLKTNITYKLSKIIKSFFCLRLWPFKARHFLVNFDHFWSEHIFFWLGRSSWGSSNFRLVSKMNRAESYKNFRLLFRHLTLLIWLG